MDKYSGMDVATLQEKLIGCYDYKERTKIRAVIKELQNPGNTGIKTYSFSQKYKRKTGSSSSPLGSPLPSPKSPLLSPKDISSRRFQYGLTNPSKSYLKSSVDKGDVAKKERKQSWKDALKDVIERQTKRNLIRKERMSSSSSDGGGTKGSDHVFVSSPVNKTFKSFLFAGNIINSHKGEGDLLHSESNLRKKFRLKSDGSDSETDKQDVSRTASVYTSRWSRLKSEDTHANSSPRNSQSSSKSFQESNFSPNRKMRLKSDGTPPSSPPHNTKVAHHTADDSFSEVSYSSRAASCKSVDSGYSSVSDRSVSQRDSHEHQSDDKMPAGSYKARIARYRSQNTGHEEPTKYVSKTIWRSSLQESNDDSVFKRETSPSDRVNKKPPPSQRKISRIKSDENLLDEPREMRKTLKGLKNGEMSSSGDVRVSPTERKMMRVKSDSNLLNSHLTTRTMNRASLLDHEHDQTRSISRLGDKTTRNIDTRSAFSRVSRDRNYKDTENGFKTLAVQRSRSETPVHLV